MDWCGVREVAHCSCLAVFTLSLQVSMLMALTRRGGRVLIYFILFIYLIVRRQQDITLHRLSNTDKSSASTTPATAGIYHLHGAKKKQQTIKNM